MRYPAAMVLFLVLISTACTSPGTRDTPSSSSSSSSSATASATAIGSPPQVPAPDIRFVMHDAYPVGDRVVVRIENIGDVTYEYQFTYEACFLSYFDPQGHEFIIPPGTHCDMLGKAPIRPGETRKLFVWNLDECVKDEWGCAKSRPLDAGSYTIRGSFRPVGDGSPAQAESTFEIQPYAGR